MTEEQEQQIRRAREVLNGAGWVFDDYINKQVSLLMGSVPTDSDGREQIYQRARVAAEIKLGLQAIVDEHDVIVELAERKAKAQEARNGR